MNKTLEKLRFLMHGKPSQGAWLGICELVDGVVAQDEVRLVVEYLEEALEGWPKGLRRAPMQWRVAMCSGRHRLQHRLASHLGHVVALEGLIEDGDWEDVDNHLVRLSMDLQGRGFCPGLYCANAPFVDLLDVYERVGGGVHLMWLAPDMRAAELLEGLEGQPWLMMRAQRWSFVLVADRESGLSHWLGLDRAGRVRWRHPVEAGGGKLAGGMAALVPGGRYAALYSRADGRLLSLDLEHLTLTEAVVEGATSLSASGGVVLLGLEGGRVELRSPRTLQVMSAVEAGGFPALGACLHPNGEHLVWVEGGDEEEFWYTSRSVRLATVHGWRRRKGQWQPERRVELHDPCGRGPLPVATPQRMVHAVEGERLEAVSMVPFGTDGVRVAMGDDRGSVHVVDMPSMNHHVHALGRRGLFEAPDFALTPDGRALVYAPWPGDPADLVWLAFPS